MIWGAIIFLTVWTALCIYLTRISANKAWRRFLSNDSLEILAPDGLTLSGRTIDQHDAQVGEIGR